jgi:hypothetical protein
MYKLLLITAILSSVCLGVQAQQNLLSNPDASGGTRDWRVYGDVVAAENARFEVRDGHAVQIVKLEDATGKFVLMIANAGTEKFKKDRILTGFPGLSGYLLRSVKPAGSEINTYMNAGSPSGLRNAPGQFSKIYGIFEVPENTVAAQVTMGRASRLGEEDDVSAAIYYNVGLYLFDTREAAIAFARKY